MPYTMRKVDGKWVVRNSDTGERKGTHSSAVKAQRQMNLLRAIKHGWKPTGKPARK